MPAMRAQASAIYIGVITIVASIGPLLVSIVTLELPEPNYNAALSSRFTSMQVPAFIDYVPSFQGCDGVRYALLCVVPIFYIASAVLFWALGIVLQLKKLRKRSKVYKVFTDEQEAKDNRTQSDQEEIKT